MADEDETTGDKWLKKLPKMESCFYLVDVDLGSKIIGYAGSVAACIFFLFDIIELAVVADLEVLNPAQKKIIKKTTGILIFDIFVQIGLLCISICLILGVRKKKRGHIKLFLVGSLLCSIAKLIAAIVFVAYLNFVTFIICLFYTVVQIYYTLVVNTYYFEMDTGGRHY